MPNHHKLSIEGMHCEACVRRVTTALRGVEGVTVDLVEIGSATITLDPARASAEQALAALTRIGIPTTLAS